MRISLEDLVSSARACEACAGHLPLGPRPVFQASASARLLIASQAPGTKAHASGVPFSDTSGARLRQGMGVSEQQFYDERRIAILPMGFCYPGRTAGGDAPPRPECAKFWRADLLAQMGEVRLTLLVGTYAQKDVLGPGKMGDRVRRFRDFLPHYFPLWLFVAAALEVIEMALSSVHAARDAAMARAEDERSREANRGWLPVHLKRIEGMIDVEDNACPCCCGTLHHISEMSPSPPMLCPPPFASGSPAVRATAAAHARARLCRQGPFKDVAGGILTGALTAQVLVSKYSDHLPLYWQAQIYARQGIQLDRSTFADWVGRAAW